MNTKGRTTATLLAAGAAVVLLLAVSSFWGDIVRFLQSDADRIQGKWKVVSGSERFTSFLFEGSTLTTTLPGSGSGFDPRERWNYRLDEDHRPRWFDMTNADGKVFHDGEVLSFRGLYELNEDTLRICTNMSGGRRPVALDSNVRSDHLKVLKRE